MRTSTKRVKIAITVMLVHEKVARFVLAPDVVVEVAAALCDEWLAVLFDSTLDLLPKYALTVGSERVDVLLEIERIGVDVSRESEPP